MVLDRHTEGLGEGDVHPESDEQTGDWGVGRGGQSSRESTEAGQSQTAQ